MVDLVELCRPGNGELVSMFGTDAVGPLVFLAIGLLGGAHCLGMCGPVVAVYAGRMRAERSRGGEFLTVGEVRQHALFNLGRTASYTLIGGLLGALGATVLVGPTHLTAVATDVHAIVGVLAGVLIAGLGARYLLSGSVAGGGHSLPVVGDALSSAQLGVLSQVDRWVGDSRIAGLGAAHGLFPCPLLYPAFLYAFVQGSPVGGALALGALGIGTVPAVFAVGTLSGSLELSTRRRLHRLLGVSFLVLGYIPFQHGLAAAGIPLPHPPIPYYQPL